MDEKLAIAAGAGWVLSAILLKRLWTAYKTELRLQTMITEAHDALNEIAFREITDNLDL
jgi:hypothetical protein